MKKKYKIFLNLYELNSFFIKNFIDIEFVELFKMHNDTFFGFLANCRLTVDDLRAVAKELVSGYLFLEVARDFKMEEADIEAVKIDNEKYNVRETSYQMLQLITKKRGMITLHELKNSLQKHNQEAWEKVRYALYQAGLNEP